jgi:hypothetical protein
MIMLVVRDAIYRASLCNLISVLLDRYSNRIMDSLAISVNRCAGRLDVDYS